MMINKPTKSLTSRTLEGISWTYFSLIFQAVLQLVTLAVLARMLGPREFGVVSLALIFTNFVERVGFLGIGPALVQKSKISEVEIQGAFLFSIILGLLIGALFYFSAPPISIFMGEEQLSSVLQALSLLCLIESACQILEHLLQRDLRFKSMLLSGNFAYAIGNGLFSISLAYYGFGVWALVYGTLITRSLRLVIFYYLRPIKIGFSFSFMDIKDILISGLGFASSRLFSFLAISSDNFIVGKMLGSVALGMYGRAYQLMTLPSNYFGQVLEKVLFPAMSKKQHEREHLEKVFLWAIQLSSLVGIPFSIFMYISSPEIVLFLFGDKWTEVIPTLKILSLGVFFRLAYKNSDTLIRSVGAVYRHSVRQGAYTAVVIFGSLYGVRFGINGVAYAVFFAVMVNYLLLSELGLRILKLSWSSFTKAHMAAIWVGVWSLLCMPPVFSFLRSCSMAPIIILIIGGAIEVILYLLCLKTCPRQFRASVIDWMIDRFKLGKRGRVGTSLLWFLK